MEGPGNGGIGVHDVKFPKKQLKKILSMWELVRWLIG